MGRGEEGGGRGVAKFFVPRESGRGQRLVYGCCEGGRKWSGGWRLCFTFLRIMLIDVFFRVGQIHGVELSS